MADLEVGNAAMFFLFILFLFFSDMGEMIVCILGPVWVQFQR